MSESCTQRFTGKWETVRLKELGTFAKGRGIKRDDVSSEGVPCIRYGELYTCYKNYISEVVSRIPAEIAATALLLRTGDILFAGSGETADEIGRCAAYLGKEKAYAGGDVIVLTPLGQNSIYFGHLMNSPAVSAQKARFGQGDAVVHIYITNLAEIEIKLPPLSEQTAIAEVLSDIDGLINSLEAVIRKKQNIKQAMMQLLLTGKTRLPGFSGAWETKRLGEIADIKTGRKNNADKETEGKYPLFVRSAIVERINSYCYDGEAVLVPGEGEIENIFHYINCRFDCHQRVYMINRFDKDICGKLIYYIMVLQFGKHALQNTVKATVDSLRLPTFTGFSFDIPKNIAEQTAIAEVLSDMDAEIAALEQRRDKTLNIKQAILQSLLTGQVRLPKPERV